MKHLESLRKTKRRGGKKRQKRKKEIKEADDPEANKETNPEKDDEKKRKAKDDMTHDRNQKSKNERTLSPREKYRLALAGGFVPKETTKPSPVNVSPVTTSSKTIFQHVPHSSPSTSLSSLELTPPKRNKTSNENRTGI